MTIRTLTVVLCQTRESHHTLDSLQKHVLGPLESDLAFCGSSDLQSCDDRLVSSCKHVWTFPEPTDWLHALDSRLGNGGAWRQLAALAPGFLGGSGLDGTIGSGAIIMYWREMLRDCLSSSILDTYEWLVITRSDFLWEVPHPQVNLLDPERIYVMDGEKYGGISDRHIIFHRTLADRILDIARPIFSEPEDLLIRLSSGTLREWNPESYILFRLRELNLEHRIVYLPYLGYTIRHEGTATRWSRGVFDSKQGVYIKYPGERKLTRVSSRIFQDQNDWSDYLGAHRSITRLRYQTLLRVVSRCSSLKHKVVRTYRMVRRRG